MDFGNTGDDICLAASDSFALAFVGKRFERRAYLEAKKVNRPALVTGAQHALEDFQVAGFCGNVNECGIV